MKVHSDVLTPLDLHAAIQRAELQGVYVDVSMSGSRSRAKAFNVRLHAEKAKGRRHTNTGLYGAGFDWAATWDEHGAWMAQLFAVDPDAIVGPYKGVNDFERQTSGAYAIA